MNVIFGCDVTLARNKNYDVVLRFIFGCCIWLFSKRALCGRFVFMTDKKTQLFNADGDPAVP
ncbi:MAG: hypothetical protein ACKVK0_05360, partial [Pirellulales bacterium]